MKDKKRFCFAAGAAGVAAASLSAGASVTQAASYVPEFLGYENAADTAIWLVEPTRYVDRYTNGTNSVPGISGAYYGRMKPSSTLGGSDGLPYDTRGPYTTMNPGGTYAYGDWPGATYHFQTMFYLDNRVQTAPGNINNESFWLPIDHQDEPFGYVGVNNYRFKRTNLSTWDIVEVGGPGMSALNLPGNKWYGIMEVYRRDDPSGFGAVDAYITKADGTPLASVTRLYPSVPAADFNGFGDIFSPRWDADNMLASTSIIQLGLPIDNTALLLGSTFVIPPLAEIPEPASFLLMAAGGVIMLRRRSEPKEA